MSAIFRAIYSAPIDRLAGIVASQRGCVDSIDADIAGLAHLMARLQRKQRLLKQVIGIDRVTQHKNLKARLRRGVLTKGASNPRAVVDYVQNGEAIAKLAESFRRMKERDKLLRFMPQHRTNAASCGYFLVETQ
jgi:hypothetical protein